VTWAVLVSRTPNISQPVKAVPLWEMMKKLWTDVNPSTTVADHMEV